MSKPLIYSYQVYQCFQVSHASSSALAIIFDYFIYLTYRYIQMLTSVALKCQFYKQTFLRQKILCRVPQMRNTKNMKRCPDAFGKVSCSMLTYAFCHLYTHRRKLILLCTPRFICSVDVLLMWVRCNF